MSLSLCVVVKSTKENFRKGDIKRETPWNKQQNYILSAYYLNRKINLRNNKRQKTENMFWKCFQNLWNALLRADMEALYAEHKIKVALYSSFWVKLHPCPLLLLIYFTLNSNVAGIDFSFFKKGVYLISFFCLLFYGITRFWNKYEQQCCGKTTLDVPEWIWLDLPLLLEIDGKSPAFPMWLSIT